MELSDLTPVLAAPGPFVTVHVGAESAVEQAADRYDLAWKSVLKQLEADGVPEPVRTALFEARGEHSDGAEPTVLGTSRADVTGLGADAVHEGPALEVLVRAALATGAGVQVVPHEPAEAPNGGVGAVLRYADDAQPADAAARS